MDKGLNYSQWKIRHEQALQSFTDKKVMMFFSGGKDSSAALLLIQQASQEFGFRFETHAGIYPHHIFTEADRDRLADYWNSRGITIQWHPIPESDDRLSEALAEGMSPCIVCNLLKKKQLMAHLKGLGVDMNSLVIIVSYSLWDLVSATIEYILGSIYSPPSDCPTLKGKPSQERFLETSQRFYPMLKWENGFSVFKPLIHYNDQEILEVIAREDIPLLSTQCRYRAYRPKRLFAQYYEGMNLQFDYTGVLNFARERLHLPEETFFTQMAEERYLAKAI